MQCAQCHLRSATVVVTTVVEDDRTVSCLCAECAREQGLGEIMEEEREGIAIMAQQSSGSGKQQPKDPDRCPNCGLTYAQFKEKYRLGCAMCYATFRDRLRPLLRKVHGAEAHRGKRPVVVAEQDGAGSAVWTLDVLRRRMQAAIEREEFEVAARLRDQIEALKKTETEEHDRT